MKAIANLTKLIIYTHFLAMGTDFKLPEGQAYSNCYRILQEREPHHTSVTSCLEQFSTVRSFPLKRR